MRIINIRKNDYAIHLKFGGKFLTSLMKLVLVAKASIHSTIKLNFLLHFGKFWAFVIAVII